MSIEQLCSEFEGTNLGDIDEVDRIRRDLLREIECLGADVDHDAIVYAVEAELPHEIVDATEVLVEACLVWLGSADSP